MNDKRNQLGANIKARRLALGLSQEALGAKAGLVAKRIGYAERGISLPYKHNLAMLATALGVTVEQLYEDPTP